MLGSLLSWGFPERPLTVPSSDSNRPSPLEGAAQALSERLRSAGADSFKVTEEQCAALAAALGRPLPPWLSGMLQTYPLSGAELSWQAVPPDDDFDGRSSVILASPDTMARESTELTPGCEILALGFVCIAADGDGTGDPYFIALSEDDPPVYRVHHEDDPADHTIGTHTATLVADHLSGFLNMLTPAT